MDEFNDERRFYEDRFQPGALAGAALVATGVAQTRLLFHGVAGCGMLTYHLRTDQVPDSYYVLQQATGVHESDVVHGGRDKLMVALQDVAYNPKPPRIIWLITSDATSLISEDLKGTAKEVEMDSGVPIIAIDCPGMLGGFARGADLALAAIVDRYASPIDSAEREGVNLVAPFLTGSSNWVNDLEEIRRLMEAADIKINTVLTHGSTPDDLTRVASAGANYIMGAEPMPELSRRTKRLGMENWGQDVVLPLGIANTESWYLATAAKFGDVVKAKKLMAKDMDGVVRILKSNDNANWGLSLLSGKRAAVLGYASFAAAMARFLLYDLNVRPSLIGLLADSPQALTRARSLLGEVEQTVDCSIIDNPDYVSWVDLLKQSDVHFAIGQIQDKPLCEGAGIAHAPLGGFYFFNHFNFVPWPYMGIRGTLTLLSEMVRLAQDAFHERRMWSTLEYRRMSVQDPGRQTAGPGTSQEQ